MSSRSVRLEPETMDYVISLGSDLEYLDAVKSLEDVPAQGRRARHDLNIGTGLSLRWHCGGCADMAMQYRSLAW